MARPASFGAGGGLIAGLFPNIHREWRPETVRRATPRLDLADRRVSVVIMAMSAFHKG
ncbi:MAG: hypothetical protein JWL74_488 [Alphaproteobacteria bacterium]|nr:hypothetical protein [Alphaproteobacteria bacterium]